MMRLVAIALVLALAPDAWAAGADSAEWDGFSRWTRAMRTMGFEVQSPEAIDLSTLPPGAGLALLDPPTDAIGGLSLFVQEGGRVLLAVEDPASASLLRAFGLQRIAAPPPIDGAHPALRSFSTPGSGLFAGVADLLANHPAALEGPLDLDPALRYPDGTAFAYHLEAGEGELLVIADASLFINLMLDGADNARFATNVARWLGRGGNAPIWFAGPETRVGGRYGDGGGESPLAGLNEALGELSRVLDPDDFILHLLLAIAIAGTLVFAIAVFPGGGPPVTDGPVLPATGRAERAAGLIRGPGAPEPAAATEPRDETKGS